MAPAGMTVAPLVHNAQLPRQVLGMGKSAIVANEPVPEDDVDDDDHHGGSDELVTAYELARG